MTAGIKTALSLLAGLIVSAALAILWFTGSFDQIEAQLYARNVEQEIGDQLRQLRSGLEQINGQRQQILQGLASSPAFQNAYRVNQSRTDIAARDREAGLLQAGTEGLLSLRVVGPDPFDNADPPGLALYYSSAPTDVLERSLDRIRYRDFAEVYADSSLTPPPVDGGETAVLADPSRQALEYRVPVVDENGVRRGVLLAAVSLRGTSSALVRLGALEPGRQIIVNPNGVLVADVPELLVPDLSEALGSPGEDADLSDGDRLILTDADRAYRIALDEGPGRSIAVLVDEDRFVLDPAIRWLVVSIAGLTTFLLLFLLLNLRQEPEILVAERMKRVQLELLQENINRSGALDMESLRAELERRKPSLVRQILRGVRGRSADESAKLDQLVDQSWNEILELMGNRGAPRTPGGSFDAEAFQRIADQIIEGIRQVQVTAQVVTHQLPASGRVSEPPQARAMAGSPRGAATPGRNAEEDLADLAPLDDAEPVEALEALDAEDLDDAEPVEALEALDAEELDDAEPVEALEALDAEELDEAEPMDTSDVAGSAEVPWVPADRAEAQPELGAELGEPEDLEPLDELEPLGDSADLSAEHQPVVADGQAFAGAQVDDLGFEELDLSDMDSAAPEQLSESESAWLVDERSLEELPPLQPPEVRQDSDVPARPALPTRGADEGRLTAEPPFGRDVVFPRVRLEPRSVVDSLLAPLDADEVSDLRLDDLDLESELAAYAPIDDETALSAIRNAEAEVAPFDPLDAEPYDEANGFSADRDGADRIAGQAEPDDEHIVHLGFELPEPLLTQQTGTAVAFDSDSISGDSESSDDDVPVLLSADDEGDEQLELLPQETEWSNEWLEAGMLFSAGASRPTWTGSSGAQEAGPERTSTGPEDHRVGLFAAAWSEVRAGLLPHTIVEDADGTVRIAPATYGDDDAEDLPDLEPDGEPGGIGSLFGDLKLDLDNMDAEDSSAESGLDKWFADDGLVISSGTAVQQVSDLMSCDALLLLQREQGGYAFIGSRSSNSRCAGVLVDAIRDLLDRVTGPALPSDREAGLQYVRHGDVGDTECIEMIGLSEGSAICALPVHGELGQVAILVYGAGQGPQSGDAPDLPELIRENGIALPGRVRAH